VRFYAHIRADRSLHCSVAPHSPAEITMAPIQRVAAVFGVVFLVVGLLGFAATGIGMGAMPQSGGTTSVLLGMFPVNAIHNVVHLAFGIWGLLASRKAGRAITYALASGAVYLLLGVLGLFTPTILGMVPIGGYDIVLHLVLAVVLASVGFWAAWFSSPQPVPKRA
jgi:hypothetical protein